MNQGKKEAYIQLHRICNHDCIFCAQPTNGLFLTYNDITKQIDDFQKEGYTWLIFSWWEPTLSPFYFDAVEYAISEWFEIRLLTNGDSMSDKNFAKKSISKGLLDYHISIHSHIEKIHDSLVKFKGSYKNSLKAMYNIVKFGGKLTINITINSYNVWYFDKTIDFLLKVIPWIEWFILNNLETSQIEAKHFWVIARLEDIALTIPQSLQLIIDAWKSVRIERVPMCYIRWYEHLSTDIEYTVLWEKKYLHYLEDQREWGEINDKTCSAHYTYWKNCESCWLKNICTGMEWLWKHYDESELITQKVNKDEMDQIMLNIDNY